MQVYIYREREKLACTIMLVVSIMSNVVEAGICFEVENSSASATVSYFKVVL